MCRWLSEFREKEANEEKTVGASAENTHGFHICYPTPNKETSVNCEQSIRALLYWEGMESSCKKLVVEAETCLLLSGQRSKQQNWSWLPRDQLRPQIVRRAIPDRKMMLLMAF